MEGQKVIKVFNHEQAAREGFNVRNEAYQQAATRAQIFAGVMMPAMGNLSYINYALTCCVGAMLAIGGGSFQLGDLALFLQCTRQVSQPITQMSQQVNTILSAVAGAERVFEVMEAQPEPDAGEVTLVPGQTGRGGNAFGSVHFVPAPGPGRTRRYPGFHCGEMCGLTMWSLAMMSAK